MLARAARRKVHPRAGGIPAATAHIQQQLTLPWLCPALLRRSSHTNAIATAPLAQASEPRRALRRSPSPRRSTRCLATTTEHRPQSSPFDAFVQAWKTPSTRAPELSRLRPWNVSDLLVVHETIAEPMKLTNHLKSFSTGLNPVELHQNLYAAIRVGRLDRASAIVGRLADVYHHTAAELVDAHNAYFQALMEHALQDPKPESMADLECWYERTMKKRQVPPSPQTFVTFLRGAMNLLPEEDQDAAIRKYMDMAQTHGEDFVDDINYSPDFTDEEWDRLLRMQPETYAEPPPVAEVQDVLVNAPASRKQLIDGGLAVDFTKSIRPVKLKGWGLDTLQQALKVLDRESKTVEYPHNMEGTKEEKDRAYAHMRQLKLETDGTDAAVARWKAEDAKLREAGIFGVMSSNPVQSLMYSWYTAILPHFKKHIEHSKKVMTDADKKTFSDQAHAYGPWLERCKPEKLAAMTVSRCVQAAVIDKEHRDHANNNKIARLALRIGGDIEDYLNSDAQTRREAFLRKQRKEIRRTLAMQLQKPGSATPKEPDSHPPERPSVPSMARTRIPIEAKTKLGVFAIETMMQNATMTITAKNTKTGEPMHSTQPAFRHKIEFLGGKKIGYILPHPQFLEKLRKESVSPIEPMRLPMLVEPKPWTGFDEGGYYTIAQRVVRTKGNDQSQRAYAESAIENGDMKKTMAALDVLGKVPWQINNNVLSVMADAWNSDETIGGLKSETMSTRPPKEPAADCTSRERQQYSRAVREYQNLRDGTHSQRCFTNFQLETARALANEPQIYFPHNVDFRGRAYPVPPLLNHMGADVARGLLRFANKKELGTVGLQWLKIHLANLYGFDKASLKEREQFAMDNIAEIYDSASDPLNGRRWWTKAEDPWQCLACCFELRNAFDAPDPTKFMSSLPVHQDGTCNGLQHYAALGGDHAGARQVNLEPSDRPQDIYTGVAELVKEMVRADADEGHPDAKFVADHITRKVVKRTVMTNVYGVTFMGAKEQVYDELRHIFPDFTPTKEVKNLATVAMYVAQKIFAALGQIFNGAQEIQYWLGECGDRITTSLTAEQVSLIEKRFEGEEVKYDSKFKMPTRIIKTEMANLSKAAETFKTSIIWTTPLKMPVVQPYRKESTRIIKTKLQNITIANRNATDAVDKRKQLQAFPPNFIHSLDAAHMALSALKCAEIGLDFAAVHDSFWTHASDVPNLNVVLRDAFVRMHSEDIIGRLAEEFKARYAGAMHVAALKNDCDVSNRIREWRVKYYRSTGRRVSEQNRRGFATVEELALEAKRQRLLKSEDPKEVAEGKAMETPTSIWLEHQDPNSLSSHRMSLLGDTAIRTKPTDDVAREKTLDGEAEATTQCKEEEARAIAPDTDIAADEQPSAATDAAVNYDVEDTLAHLEADASDFEPKPKSRKRPAKDDKNSADKASVPLNNLTIWLPLSFPPTPSKGGESLRGGDAVRKFYAPTKEWPITTTPNIHIISARGGPSVEAWGLPVEWAAMGNPKGSKAGTKGQQVSASKLIKWWNETQWRRRKVEEAKQSGETKGRGMRLGKMKVGGKMVRTFMPSRLGVGDY